MMRIVSEHSEPDAPFALRQLILAWFDTTDLGVSPPEWLRSAVLAMVPAQPPDISPEVAEHPHYCWLRLASCLDFAGDLDGSRILLDRIEASAQASLPATSAQELIALVCARRGRLARQLGEVDAAIEWYRVGLARTEGARHRDAWSSCVQGLANCAQYRNDLHTAERLSRLVSVNHALVPEYARVNALITLSVIYRKQGRVPPALRTAWQVHDLVHERDERRATALVQVAHLALERGEPGAALRGFDVVLSFARTCGVRRPALSGALAATLAIWRHAPDRSLRLAVQTRISALLEGVQLCKQPWERAHGYLDALNGLHSVGQAAQAGRIAMELEKELSMLAKRGAPLEWAERQLSERRLAPDSKKRGGHDIRTARYVLSNAETEALSRLATLSLIHATA